MIQNKILIVDDEKAITILMEQIFSRAGYEVKSAGSGEEALELLKKDKIQVMFLDLNMPGMDGIELCKAIRKDMPMAMIFAVTGYASLFQLSDCREAGFDDYFKKPVKIKTLLATAENAFEKINRWKEK
ncbi:MAG: response regulator [Desulfobacula sp.]|uniref:response regulator n=1 Tax=Desulfobacula sp. TaxID=2593537 RepID=UPI0025BFC9A3|nr:response regulator [Desulfobacula sp.]MCD4720228.1 response regulator [Desulfobacula sp.]